MRRSVRVGVWWGEVKGGWARGGGVEPEGKTTILESIERLGVLEHEKSI